MGQYFPKLYEPFGRELLMLKADLFNYQTKTDIKNILDIDTSSFVLKSNLASLKIEVDKLGIDKLKSLPNNLSDIKGKLDKLEFDKLAAAPVGLSELSNVVKNDVVKKTEYNAKIKSIEDKISDIINLATKTIISTKINEVKTKH